MEQRQLRERMALYGFESNEDYQYPIECLLYAPFEGIRCLNIQGDSQRRKTAFASALANALEVPHTIYHDFSERTPPPPQIILPPSRDESGKEAPPINPLDNRLADACGYSEAEETILILDQLQAADFREHIRLYKFITSGEWQLGGTTHFANPRHLLTFVISEEPLYHSLQKQSFRIWISSVSHCQITYAPQDFGLDPDAGPLLNSLAELFAHLQISPTRSEYAKILRDLTTRIRHRDALRWSIYGWMEEADRHALLEEPLEPILDQVVNDALGYLGCQEVELFDVAEER